MDEKNSAPVMAGQEAPQTASMGSIPQVGVVPQAKSSDSRKKRKRGAPSPLGIKSSTYTIAIKCYAEQLPYGLEETLARIRQIDKKEFQVLAIVHDRDTVTDGIWEASSVKSHLHIIMRGSTREKRVVVSTALNMLGVYFRPGIDDELWHNHGVETVGNFEGYAMYLTHETKDAIDAAKELYDVSEIISNLTPEEVAAVREGYIRVSSASHKLTMDELAALDKEAYDLGYNMKNFDEWYDIQPFNVRSHAKVKTIKESYNRGVDKRVGENAEVVRMCVYIEGPKNCGKTYAAQKALEGKRTIRINGGGTGKFDKLRPDHEAVIIDDDTCPNLLNMTDNYICRVYRRQSNNPAWAGKSFIVTSNLPFEEWLEQCKINIYDKNYHGTDYNNAPKNDHYHALVSRFFICKINFAGQCPHLECVSESTRGTAEERKERNKMFMEFIKRFNDTIKGYHPEESLGEEFDVKKELEYERKNDEKKDSLEERGITLVTLPYQEYVSNKKKLLNDDYYMNYPEQEEYPPDETMEEMVSYPVPPDDI